MISSLIQVLGRSSLAAARGLAKAIGASAVFLGTGACEHAGVYPFPSLAAAAPFILERITV